MSNMIKNRAVDDVAIDAADENVITFSCASSEPCLRDNDHGPYYEILTISEDSVDFERLVDQRAPLLLQHDDDKQIGVIEKAFIKDGKVYVTARFSRNPMPQEILADIKDGIRRNVSIGYTVDDSIMKHLQDFDYPVEEVTRFTILEVSIVSIPADDKVGMGRSKDKAGVNMKIKKVKKLKEFDLTEEEMKKLKELLAEDEETKEEEITDEEAAAETNTEISEEAGGEEAAGEITEEDREGEEAAEDELELKECEEEEKECEDEEEIRSLGDLLNKRALAEKFIRAHKSLKQFKAALKQNVNNRNLKDNNKMQKFSIRKAILAKAGRIKADEAKFEMDVIAENQRKFNSDADIVLSKRELRAFDGTEALNQPVYQPGLYTPNLRPPVTVDAIGTKKVAVTGPSITFSVCTSGITAGFVGLDGDVPSATMDFQLKRMDPKKQGAFVDIAYSSLLQDDPSAEGIVMDDIFKALDQSKDNAFWNGLSGNNEPIGLLNTTGVNEVTLPDTPTLSTALEFEKKIRESYDYSGNLKWVFGSEAYYKWASTPYSATEQNKMLLDPDERKCIGYDCYMDPNLPASGVVLGNFDEALEADFDGIELRLITEDKDLARKQAVEVIAWRALDFLCRRPKSFSKGV